MRLTNSLMALTQGVYFFVTAIWPYVHLPSFLFVTGPKTDIWLLKTVAMLLAVIGLVLLLAGFRKTVSPEIKLLAIGAEGGLILIDLVYSTTNTISDIYRFDALAEAILIAGWLVAKPENAER